MLYLPLIAGFLILFIEYKTGKRKNKWHHSILPLLLLYVIITIDLGINYSSNSGFNDGIAMTGLISRVVILTDRWSLQLFKEYYLTSMLLTVLVFIVYFVLYIIETFRSE